MSYCDKRMTSHEKTQAARALIAHAVSLDPDDARDWLETLDSNAMLYRLIEESISTDGRIRLCEFLGDEVYADWLEMLDTVTAVLSLDDETSLQDVMEVVAEAYYGYDELSATHAKKPKARRKRAAAAE